MEEKYLMEKLREIRRMETYIWNTGHRMARRWLDREELYKGDPHLLMLVSMKEGCAQNELARRLFVTPATLTVMLNRMEKAGLVVRKTAPLDQRSQLVYATKKGRDIGEKTYALLEKAMRRAYEGITEEELEAYKRVLEKVRKNVEEMAEEGVKCNETDENPKRLCSGDLCDSGTAVRSGKLRSLTAAVYLKYCQCGNSAGWH